MWERETRIRIRGANTGLCGFGMVVHGWDSLDPGMPGGRGPQDGQGPQTSKPPFNSGESLDKENGSWERRC